MSRCFLSLLLKTSGFSSLLGFPNKAQGQNAFRFFTFKPFFFFFPLSFWKFWSPWQHRHPSALPSWSCHQGRAICGGYHSNVPGFALQRAAGVLGRGHDRRDHAAGPGSARTHRAVRPAAVTSRGSRGCWTGLVLLIVCLVKRKPGNGHIKMVPKYVLQFLKLSLQKYPWFLWKLFLKALNSNCGWVTQYTCF